METPAKTPLVDQLRNCSPEAEAVITEPNGWSYSTNIGKLLHDAADELAALKAENAALREALEWIEGACGDRFVCLCGLTTGVQALKEHAHAALLAKKGQRKAKRPTPPKDNSAILLQECYELIDWLSQWYFSAEPRGRIDSVLAKLRAALLSGEQK